MLSEEGVLNMEVVHTEICANTDKRKFTRY